MNIKIESPFGSSNRERIQERVFVSTFAMLAKLAEADGRISKSEAITVDKLIREVLKLNEAKRSFAINIFNASRKTSKSFRFYAEEYKQLLNDKPKMYEWMLDVLMRLSFSDGNLGEVERKLIEEAGEIFGIEKTKFNQLISRHLPKNKENAYKILGLESGAGTEEINTRYRSLLQEYDPKRLIDLGLPDDFVVIAKERLNAVESAYNIISKS